MSETETCYCCPRPATSREHVPPRCMFPFGYRSNLITVPACSDHNHNKKTDDEYFRSVVVSAIHSESSNTPHGSAAVDTLIRSYDKNPNLLPRFLKRLRMVEFQGQQTAGFTVDMQRFKRSCCYIVRGLFYHTQRKRLHEDISIHWARMTTSNFEISSANEELGKLLASLPRSDYRGSHPDVFCYSFHVVKSKHHLMYVCRMKFYDGRPICGVWKSPKIRTKGKTPEEIVKSLMPDWVE